MWGMLLVRNALILGLQGLPLVQGSVHVKGPSSSRDPYLRVDQSAGGTAAKIVAILSGGDSPSRGNSSFRLVGKPDGLSTYIDPYDSRFFNMQVNHEISIRPGTTLQDRTPRAHGFVGAFVSTFKIHRETLEVVSGRDLVQSSEHIHLTRSSTVIGQPASEKDKYFERLCSADIPVVTALYNSKTGRGTKDMMHLAGEEVTMYLTPLMTSDRTLTEDLGGMGRAFAFMLTGDKKDHVWELPGFGHLAFENLLASPFEQDLTIVFAPEDAPHMSVVGLWVGMKQTEGNAVQKAGLMNGTMYAIQVQAPDGTAWPMERLAMFQPDFLETSTTETTDSTVVRSYEPPATSVQTDVQETFSDDGMTVVDVKTTTTVEHTGRLKTTKVVTQTTTTKLLQPRFALLPLPEDPLRIDPNNVTLFQRPEDGVWDPVRPGRFYFASSYPPRVWALSFDDIENPWLGGNVSVVLEGVGYPGKFYDNMALSPTGDTLMVTEDAMDENNFIWAVNVSSRLPSSILDYPSWGFDEMWSHSRLIGTHRDPPLLMNGMVDFSDFAYGEFSGILSAEAELGPHWWFVADMTHKQVVDPDLLQDAQLLAFHLPPEQAAEATTGASGAITAPSVAAADFVAGGSGDGFFDLPPTPTPDSLVAPLSSHSLSMPSTRLPSPVNSIECPYKGPFLLRVWLHDPNTVYHPSYVSSPAAPLGDNAFASVLTVMCDFGDGTVLWRNESLPYDGLLPSLFPHTYTEAGVFTLSLTSFFSTRPATTSKLEAQVTILAPPTSSPTSSPSLNPTENPSTTNPTANPSTVNPTSANPTTANPSTINPTSSPTLNPTSSPSLNPTSSPSRNPTSSPSLLPTSSPSLSSTSSPSLDPTFSPSLNPRSSSSLKPSSSPFPNISLSEYFDTSIPTSSPSLSPTFSPSLSPTFSPSLSPTFSPSLSPTFSPSLSPTFSPSLSPTFSPSLNSTSLPLSLFSHFKAAGFWNGLRVAAASREISLHGCATECVEKVAAAAEGKEDPCLGFSLLVVGGGARLALDSDLQLLNGICFLYPGFSKNTTFNSNPDFVSFFRPDLLTHVLNLPVTDSPAQRPQRKATTWSLVGALILSLLF